MEADAPSRSVKRSGEAAAGALKRRAALGTVTNVAQQHTQADKVPVALLPPSLRASAVGVAAALPAPEAKQPFDQPPALLLPAAAREPLSSTRSLSPDESLASVHSAGWADPQTAPLRLLLPAEDPHNSTLYFGDIFAHNRRFERQFRPKPEYMRRQRDITNSMRTILVDWLVEVAEEYRLSAPTLNTAVSYIDRFLSEMGVQRGKLQLVGVTCMLLAAKYEEIYPPAVEEFVYITDNTYTREQIMKMEHVVLNVLGFDMGSATPFTFLEPCLAGLRAHDRVRFMALFFAETTLLDGERFLRFLPSTIAAACLSLTLHTLAMPHWPALLQHLFGGTEADVTQCMRAVFDVVSAPATTQRAIQEKYATTRFLGVSRVPVPSVPAL